MIRINSIFAEIYALERLVLFYAAKCQEHLTIAPSSDGSFLFSRLARLTEELNEAYSARDKLTSLTTPASPWGEEH
jgi:hypothetical protein